MASHLTKQQHDSIWKPESASILSAPFGDLFKALMFLSNLNGFNSSPSPLDQGFAKQKGLLNVKVFPRCGRKNAQSDPVTCSLSPLMVMHYLFVLLSDFESV